MSDGRPLSGSSAGNSPDGAPPADADLHETGRSGFTAYWSCSEAPGGETPGVEGWVLWTAGRWRDLKQSSGGPPRPGRRRHGRSRVAGPPPGAPRRRAPARRGVPWGARVWVDGLPPRPPRAGEAAHLRGCRPVASRNDPALPAAPAAAPWRRHDSYLVDSASSHMLVSKIKPCMSGYKQLYSETANGSLYKLSFI